MSEANKRLVRNFFKAIDQRDPASIEQFVAEDYEDHYPIFPDLPDGIAGVRMEFELSLAAFSGSDFRHEIEDQIAEGDKVVSRIKAWGTHTGDFMGIPATGKEVTMEAIVVHRIANGKIVEHWSQVDALRLYNQLGAFPPHTILFTDMESSTALTQRLGDEKAQELVREHNTIVREALSAHEGTEIKHTGDGIMASFTSASHALGCAVAIQRAVAARAAEQPEIPLGLHIGLNAGEPLVEEQDLFGASVQLAKRICEHAEPGQILTSNLVRELATGKGFLFADIGEVVPKGFEEPVQLYEVLWREEG